MNGTVISIDTLHSRPDLRHAVSKLDVESFPKFLTSSRTAEAFRYVTDNYPETILFIHKEGSILAACFSAPLELQNSLPPSGGWEGAMGAVLAGGNPNALFAFSISVAADARGLGLGGKIIDALRDKAKDLGYSTIITPIRPTALKKHPSLSLEDYAYLVDSRTGYSIDPWIRTLQRHNSQVIGIGQNSHVVKTDDGSWPTVEQWKNWTGLDFPADGEYDITGGCAKLKVHDGIGEYREDCIWMAVNVY